MKILNRLVSVLAAAALAVPMMPGMARPAVSASAYGLTMHTPAEIRAFYKAHPWSVSDKTTYSETPSTSAPYAAGAVSEASQQRALNCVNFFRYTAGLPADVTLSEQDAQLAQAASLVSALNRELSHQPKQPSGLSDELYSLGKQGAGSCNLGSGYSTLPDSVATGYMVDSDSYNIPMVGHRRWILNPSMQKTGFGQVGSYSAMYVFDTSRSGSFTGDAVMWPAPEMPYQIYKMSGRYAFSVSLGSAYDRPGSGVSVQMHSQKKNADYEMSASSCPASGYFNINTDGYGMANCIIFYPGVQFDMDDTLSVSVSGLTKSGQSAALDYTVRFFDLEAEDTETTTAVSDSGLGQTSTTTTTYLPQLRSGSVLFTYTNPGTEFKISVTPRGKTVEKISLFLYGTGGEEAELTLMDSVMTGSEPFEETIRTPFLTNKISVSVSYRGDSPELRCSVMDADEYSHNLTTDTPGEEKVWSAYKTFTFNEPGTKFRISAVPKSELEGVYLRFYGTDGRVRDVTVLNSTVSYSYEKEVTAPFPTEKITAEMRFRGAVPAFDCTLTEAYVTTTTTTTTTSRETTTTTTTRQYPVQTVSMKFNFGQTSDKFIAQISKYGGSLEKVVLHYVDAYGGEHSTAVLNQSVACSAQGVEVEFNITAGTEIDELSLDITYNGSLPEVACDLIDSKGNRVSSSRNFCGDVDCNGKISIADAVLLARYNAEDTGVTVTPAGKLNADTDHNGVIEAADCALLLEYLAGVRSGF